MSPPRRSRRCGVFSDSSRAPRPIGRARLKDVAPCVVYPQSIRTSRPRRTPSPHRQIIQTRRPGAPLFTHPLLRPATHTHTRTTYTAATTTTAITTMVIRHCARLYSTCLLADIVSLCVYTCIPQYIIRFARVYTLRPSLRPPHSLSLRVVVAFGLGSPTTVFISYTCVFYTSRNRKYSADAAESY